MKSQKNTFKNNIFFLLLSFITLFSCNSGKEILTFSNKEKKDDAPALHIEGFTLSETIEGIKQWELKGKKADIFEDKDLISIDKIEMVFFSKDQFFSNLYAENAELNIKNKNIISKKNVKVIAKNKIILETEELIWDAEKKIFTTDAPVKIIKKDSVLTGIGLITNPGLENIKVLKDVKVTTKEALQLMEEK